MSTARHQPEADVLDVAATLHLATVRPGGDGVVGVAAPPPEDLLPSGGSDRGDQAPVGLDAAFLCEVDVVRRQLAPLRTRGALAASFGREAGHRAGDGPGLGRAAEEPITPLRFAYALRWLELGRLQVPPEWADLLDGPLE